MLLLFYLIIHIIWIDPISIIHEEMRAASPATRKFFTPSLTKEQTAFVKEVPEDVKRLIRIIKYKKNHLEVIGYNL